MSLPADPIVPSGSMIVYVHGFNSSPASVKARLLRERLQSLGREAEFLAPGLPHRPAEAARVLDAVADRHPEATLIGSSLGGFYATWLVERRERLRAVLVNPAVRPYELLRAALGRQRNLYTGEEYDFTPRHLEELAALEVPAIARPGRYLLLAQTGDEVLDYRQAVARYRGCRQVVIPGGDHGFRDFGACLDAVLGFHDAAGPELLPACSSAKLAPQALEPGQPVRDDRGRRP